MNAGNLATVERHVLTICTYTEFAPFAFMKDAVIAGSDIALLRCFADGEGLSVKIRQHGFMNLWQRPAAGECDVAAAGLAALPERELGALAVWSVPYLTVHRSLLIRAADALRLRSPEDFRGKRIVVTAESTADLDARERYVPWGAELIDRVPSQHEVVRALLAHEVDAFAEGDVSNQFLADAYGNDARGPLLALSDVHPMKRAETLHFAVRAIEPQLVARLDAFIRKHGYDARKF